MLNENLLEIVDLKTYYYMRRGVLKAVDGISLTIRRREIVGLAGESGCGKSTVALSIMRLVPTPQGRILGGKILFEDKNLLDLTEEKIRNIRGKVISIVFQEPMNALNPVMTVGQQIAEAILENAKYLNKTLSKEDVRHKVIDGLKVVQIPSPKAVADSYPHQLSGGMRQRVLISMALSCNPSLLIADEPTTALDVTVQAQIIDLLIELRSQLESSILLITHDLGVLAELVDRVYVMYAGKIVEYGGVFDVFENPRHPYTVGLLRSSQSLHGLEKTIATIGGMVPDLIQPPLGCRFHPRCPAGKRACSEREPPFTQVEPGHAVSCWHTYGE